MSHLLKMKFEFNSEMRKIEQAWYYKMDQEYKKKVIVL